MSNRQLLSGRVRKRYTVGNNAFRVVNGPQSYNRSLYGALQPGGTHRFRVFAGDRPELMLYLPGDGGRILIGLASGQGTKWLHDCDFIQAEYDGAEMKYTVRDAALGDGEIRLSVIPLAERPGLLVGVETERTADGCKLLVVCGGASGERNDRAFDPGYNSQEKLVFRSESCRGNRIETQGRSFRLSADWLDERAIVGRSTFGEAWYVTDALRMGEPAAPETGLPMAAVRCPAGELRSREYLLLEYGSPEPAPLDRPEADKLYAAAAAHYRGLAERVVVRTPSETLDAAVRASCTAMEAIWVPPVYVHGAWSWDAPYAGWRSMYGAVAYGWHERVREEARFFAGLQLAEADAGGASRKPDPDPAYQWARQSSDSIFVSPGMMPFLPDSGSKVVYNMQEVWIDQLVREYEWTGDPLFGAELFPVLRLHLDWEERCFDGDGDGLYENYANYWASDGVFASGAGCALASAYNYRANAAAAGLAARLGEDPQPFARRADKIRRAVQEKLWLAERGYLAEMRDTLGEKLLHTDTSLPTIVHAAESGILDPFQIYQMLRFSEHHLERVRVEGSAGELVWNTNWAPYRCSVRDLDYADVMHAALAYYGIGQTEAAYKLLSGAVEDSTCNHVAPGGFMCAYEGKPVDFADTVSMFGRTLTEGLFGIRPRMDFGKVIIAPGFPRHWTEASIRTPDVEYAYVRSASARTERLEWRLARPAEVELRLIAGMATVRRVTVNAEATGFAIAPGIGHSLVVVRCPAAPASVVEIEYGDDELRRLELPDVTAAGATIELTGGAGLVVTAVYDPQRALQAYRLTDDGGIVAVVGSGAGGRHTFFLRVADRDADYWQPVNWEIRSPVDFTPARFRAERRELETDVRNNTDEPLQLRVRVEAGGFAGGMERQLALAPHCSAPLVFALDDSFRLSPGTNAFDLDVVGDATLRHTVSFTDWSLPVRPVRPARLDRYFNDRVGDLFKQEFVSPRSPFCSLQTPLHLVPADWCVTGTEGLERINDLHLRRSVDERGLLHTPEGLTFRQIADPERPNAAFVSQWDNYPTALEVPLTGSGGKLYLLVAGYTNQMQCGVPNGTIEAVYEDGSVTAITLAAPRNFRSMDKGPETERPCDAWCYGDVPLPRILIGDSRDARRDGDQDAPPGNESWEPPAAPVVDKLYAQLLDMALEPGKTMTALRIKAVANDVVIGLLGVSVLEND